MFNIQTDFIFHRDIYIDFYQGIRIKVNNKSL
jgi:hypothetical protein